MSFRKKSLINDCNPILTQEVEVTDQEMADRYANLVGTVNKKFTKKVGEK